MEDLTSYITKYQLEVKKHNQVGTVDINNDWIYITFYAQFYWRMERGIREKYVCWCDSDGFVKSFDFLANNLILSKLSAYGMSYDAVSLFKIHLLNGQQYV